MAPLPEHRPSGRRWAVLAFYAILLGVSQMLWLNFAPLISQVQKTYGVSELVASSLVLIFPFLYILLSLPAGTMIDRRGYKSAIALGGWLSLIFACVRMFDQNFWMLWLGQLGIAAGQPFILNGISKLVADWFGREETATATGLASLGMFLGMALGMAATPALVAAAGLQTAMAVFAGVTAVSAISFSVFVKENHSQTLPKEAFGFKEIWRMLSSRNLALLCILALFGIGFFNGLVTWLEEILKPRGLSAADAGLVGGVLTLAGVAGSAVLPALSDFFHRRKPFLFFSLAGSMLLVHPLCVSGGVWRAVALGGAVGFSMLPAYALLLAMCEETVGPEHAGLATGILLLAGNFGSVVIPVAMQMSKEFNRSWNGAVFLLMGLMAAGIGVLGFIRETGTGGKKNGDLAPREDNADMPAPVVQKKIRENAGSSTR